MVEKGCNFLLFCGVQNEVQGGVQREEAIFVRSILCQQMTSHKLLIAKEM
jgi:hypothetical protein